MKKMITLLTVLGAVLTFGAYSVGDTVSLSDNISWTDNYGYSSDIFTEVQKGKVVVIFFGTSG
ncbi:MAG TPA: hypothetical protein PKW56_03805 [Clostridiales bacterium]|nr:hypothetical protein [Clostridiales bacterium]